MKLPRRTFLHLAAGAAALLGLSQNSFAQTYPARAVRIIVGFPAGGSGLDIIARLLSRWLSERLGQQFVVENRPGAGSNLAAEAVVKAPPDGYTLLLLSGTNAINATLYDNLTFDFLHDIAPVAGITRAPFVFVAHPSLPAKTIPELIAYAKSNPGKISMASNGNGSGPHIYGELFMVTTGIDMLHVPYRSNAFPDLLSGEVQVMFSSIPPSIQYIRTGKLLALGVTTTTRSEALPGIPAISEFVPGYEAIAWQGVGVPRGTPLSIINKLNHEINAGLADPNMVARLSDLGGTPMTMSPTELGELIVGEVDKWSKVIRAANIRPD
jgi:tripartite-type tricarboxylate transporter receptor subunit TctC